MEWTNGEIKVGRSMEDILLQFTDTDPFTVVEIKLYTVGTAGYWTFNNNMGNLFSI